MILKKLKINSWHFLKRRMCVIVGLGWRGILEFVSFPVIPGCSNDSRDGIPRDGENSFPLPASFLQSQIIIVNQGEQDPSIKLINPSCASHHSNLQNRKKDVGTNIIYIFEIVSVSSGSMIYCYDYQFYFILFFFLLFLAVFLFIHSFYTEKLCNDVLKDETNFWMNWRKFLGIQQVVWTMIVGWEI